MMLYQNRFRDAALRGEEEKRRQQENEAYSKQYQALSKGQKSKIATRKEGHTRQETAVERFVAKIEEKRGNTYTMKLKKGKTNTDSMYQAVTDLKLNREEIEDLMKRPETLKIRLKDGVTRDIVAYNAVEENMFYVGSIKEKLKTVRFLDFPTIREQNYWDETIMELMKPYAMEVLKIEKTKWGTPVHGEFFKGMRDGGIDVQYLPREKERDIPPYIPFKHKDEELEGIIVVTVIYTGGANRAVEVCKYCRLEGHNGDDYERLNECEGYVELEIFEKGYTDGVRKAMAEDKKRYEPEQARKIAMEKERKREEEEKKKK